MDAAVLAMLRLRRGDRAWGATQKLVRIRIIDGEESVLLGCFGRMGDDGWKFQILGAERHNF
jgi:hypothetical protein